MAVGDGRGGGGGGDGDWVAMNEATQSFLSGWDDSEASEWILLNSIKQREFGFYLHFSKYISLFETCQTIMFLSSLL